MNVTSLLGQNAWSSYKLDKLGHAEPLILDAACAAAYSQVRLFYISISPLYTNVHCGRIQTLCYAHARSFLHSTWHLVIISADLA